MRQAFDGYGVYGALIGVYLLTLVLTELVTNNAAAALAFPIALATARAFGVDPTAFVMVVAYGASACFLVPFGYQTHLMVMSPGHYRVTDFFRAGLPVSLTYSVVVLLLTPVFFPLTAV
ncbi:transporter, divalent anion:Na+ symporter (DASS) family [compost metagenome]|jgi:di/tricarboxylate transporter